MFSKIVVGVAGTGESRDAIRLASVLAGLTGAEVLLAHVYPADPYDLALGLGDDVEALTAHAEQLLAGELPFAPPGSRTLAIAGRSPSRSLQHLAEEEHADLLVVSSSRRGRVGRVLLGDGARQTVHHAPCAVAVAPRGYAATTAALATITVGYDSSPECRRALSAAEELAGRAGARLTLVSAIAPPFEGAVAYTYPYPVDWTSYYEERGRALQAELDTLVPGLSVPAGTAVEQGWPPAVLEEASRACDLLVVGSRHWGAVNRLLLGSTSTTLVGRAHCPLLVVPRGEEQEEQPAATASAAVA